MRRSISVQAEVDGEKDRIPPDHEAGRFSPDKSRRQWVHWRDGMPVENLARTFYAEQEA